MVPAGETQFVPLPINPGVPWRRMAAAVVRNVTVHWPAVAAIALLLVLTLTKIYEVKAREAGKFIYPVDDVYMHLAVAKNLVRHGIWGVSPHDGFCHCVSSLNWPWAIAACFLVFGVHEYLPILLNLAAASMALIYAGNMLRRSTGSAVGSALVLWAIVLLAPLTAVVLLGMEHSLQILACLLFVDLGARSLARNAAQTTGVRTPPALCAAAVLLVTSRYEGLFLVTAVGGLLVCRRRWTLAAALGLCAAAPLTIFGGIAVAKGWAFWPTSLLLKGNTQTVASLSGLLVYLGRGYGQLVSQKHFSMTVLAMAVAGGASLWRHRSVWSYSTLVLLITLLGTVQHLQFASLGWFYRYEAYLIVLTLVGVGIVAFEGFPPLRAGGRLRVSTPAYAGLLILAATYLGTPLWRRGAYSLPHIVSASYNIYEQQHQMGRFVRRFYQGRGVLANDIGELTYMADIKLVDIAGLATLESLRARLGHTFDHALVRRLSREHGVELVMVYESSADVFHGPLPEWVPVGRWTIQNNTVTGGATVSFYAPERSLVPRLTRELREFARELPADVIQEGSYTAPS